MPAQIHKTVKIANGTEIPAIGLGTWFLGESKAKRSGEEAALWAGLEAGARLIDTAEMYGDGRSEELVGAVTSKTDRKELYLVSKVLPSNASKRDLPVAFYRSLERMRTDYLDMYLLHWRGPHPLKDTISALEALVAEGVLKGWGVSNLDRTDMEELWSLPQSENCQFNQVLYHLASRGVEVDLLAEMYAHDVAMMAYCPLAQGGTLRQGRNIFTHPTVRQIAIDHGVSPAQILLAFAIRDGHTIAIPRSATAEHTLDNVRAGNLELSPSEFEDLERAFPAPTHPVPLDIT